MLKFLLAAIGLLALLQPAGAATQSQTGQLQGA